MSPVFLSAIGFIMCGSTPLSLGDGAAPPQHGLIVEIADSSNLCDTDQDGNQEWVPVVMIVPGASPAPAAGPFFRSGPMWDKHTNTWGLEPALKGLGSHAQVAPIGGDPNGTFMTFTFEKLTQLTGIGDGQKTTGFVHWPTGSGANQDNFCNLGLYIGYVPTASNSYKPLGNFGTQFNANTTALPYEYSYALCADSSNTSKFNATDGTIPKCASPTTLPQIIDSNPEQSWFLYSMTNGVGDAIEPWAVEWMTDSEGALSVRYKWKKTDSSYIVYPFPTTGTPADGAVNLSNDAMTIEELGQNLGRLQVDPTTGVLEPYPVPPLPHHQKPALVALYFASPDVPAKMATSTDQEWVNVVVKTPQQTQRPHVPANCQPQNNSPYTPDQQHCFNTDVSPLPQVPLWQGGVSAAPWGSGVRWQRVEYQMQTADDTSTIAGDADATILTHFGFPTNLKFYYPKPDISNPDPNAAGQWEFPHGWHPSAYENIFTNMISGTPSTDATVRPQLIKSMRTDVPQDLKDRTNVYASANGKADMPMSLAGPNVFNQIINPYNSFQEYWLEQSDFFPCITKMVDGRTTFDNVDTSGPQLRCPGSGKYLRIQDVQTAADAQNANTDNLCDILPGIQRYWCKACYLDIEAYVDDVLMPKGSLMVIGNLDPFTIVSTDYSPPNLPGTMTKEEWLEQNFRTDPSIEWPDSLLTRAQPYTLSPSAPEPLMHFLHQQKLCDDAAYTLEASLGVVPNSSPPQWNFSIRQYDNTGNQHAHKTFTDIGKMTAQDFFAAVTGTYESEYGFHCGNCPGGSDCASNGDCALLVGGVAPVAAIGNLKLEKFNLTAFNHIVIPAFNPTDCSTSATSSTPTLPFNANATNATNAIYAGDWYQFANTADVVIWIPGQGTHLVFGSDETAPNQIPVNFTVSGDPYQATVTYEGTIKNINRDISAAYQFGIMPTQDSDAYPLKFVNAELSDGKRKLQPDLVPFDPDAFALHEVPSGNWMLIDGVLQTDPLPLFEELQPNPLPGDVTAYSDFAYQAYLYAGPKIYGQTYSDFLSLASHPGIDIQWPSSGLKMAKLAIEIPSLLPADFDMSGRIDIVDVLYCLQYWGMPNADLNNDGTTDVYDLLITIYEFDEY